MKRSLYKQNEMDLGKILAISLGVFFVILPLGVHAQSTNTTYNSSLGPASQQNYDSSDAALCNYRPTTVSGVGNLAITSGSDGHPANTDGSLTTCNYVVAGTGVKGDPELVQFTGGTVTFPNNPNAGSVNVSQSGGQLVSELIGKPGATATPVSGQNGTGTATGASVVVGNKCDLTTLPGFEACATGAVAAIALLILGLMGYLLGFVGALFNWVVLLTVFQFGNYFGNSSGLLLAWGVLRDIGNIALLAAFIWFGIQIILDINSGATRKAIPMLIIVGLLLNFSLFAAEAVIDVSDVLSAAMYNQAGGGQSTCTVTITGGCVTNTGLAATVITDAGITNIFSSGGNFSNALDNIGDDPTHKMIVYIGLTIFVSVTLAVLLTAAIILLIRAIVLVFVMILAPVGFAAMAIPGLESTGKRWRDLLLSQSFFAPVYFLMLLVSLKVIEAVKNSLLNGSGGATLLTALDKPTTNSTTVVLVFVLMIGFLIAAQMSAKSMGAIGASWATNAANKTTKWAALTPLKVSGGFAYRHTAAPVFDKTGKLYASAVGAGRASKFAPLRIATKLFDNAAGSSIEGTLNSAKNVKFLGAKSYDEKKKADEERAHHTEGAFSETKKRSDFKKALAEGFAKSNGSLDPKDLESFEKAERALQSFTQPEFEKYYKTASAQEKKLMAKLASTDTIEKAAGNKDFEHEAHQLIHDRFDILEHAAEEFNTNKNAATFKTLKDIVRALPDEESRILAKHSPDMFRSFAGATNELVIGGDGESVWSLKQIDDNSKNKALTKAQQRIMIATKRSKQLEEAIKSDNSVAAQTLLSKMQNDVADVGEGEFFDSATGNFKNATAAVYVSKLNSARKMSAIMKADKLSDEAKTKILDYWEARGRANPRDPEYVNVAGGVNKGNAQNWWGRKI